MKEKRREWQLEAAKFSTQEKVSGSIIFIMAAVIANLCWRGEVTDIKEVYNTLLPFFGIVIGFWIGSSKGSADKEAQLSQIRKSETPQSTDTDTVGAAKETVKAAKETVAVAEEQGK